MVSMYAEDEPAPVYDNEIWWGDSWSGLDYGQDIDFNRPFFDQFFELVNKVPKMARVQQGENVNAEFTNCASYNRNCYLVFSSNNNEDCQYGTFVRTCKDCFDNYYVNESELCSNSFNCIRCYKVQYCQNCMNCSDSWFCRSCVGCKNCYGCVNAHNKEYYWFNEQLSKEEYAKKLESVDTCKYSVIENMKKQVCEMEMKLPFRYYEGIQNQNVSGNYISYSKNSNECYDSAYLEDCKYCTRCWHMSDTQDVSNYGVTQINERCYSSMGIGHGLFNVLFSMLIWSSSDILYSHECYASKYLFGCSGLRRKEYCILNKQYSEEEYQRLSAKLAEHMQNTGEWGKFFDSKFSLCGYNETVAYDYYPLTKDEARKKGFRWREAIDDIPAVEKIIPAEDLPDSIDDIPDDVLNWAIKCKETDRPYLINSPELEFYRKINIPIPRFHPDIRHQKRMESMNPHVIWDRQCSKCSKPIKTTYSPDRPEIVYCESCYLQSVY